MAAPRGPGRTAAAAAVREARGAARELFVGKLSPVRRGQPSAELRVHNAHRAAHELYSRQRAGLSPVGGAPPAGADAAGPSSTLSGYNNTLGWSGEIGPAHLPGQTHLAQIHAGMQAMDKLAPGLRQRLDQLVRPDAGLCARNDALTEEARVLYGQQGKLSGVRTPAAQAESARIGSRLDAIVAEQVSLQEKLHDTEVANRAQAAEPLADVLLSRLRHQSKLPDMSDHVKIDAAALAELKRKNISPETLKQWVNEFHSTTGLGAPSKPYRFTFEPGRPHYLAGDNSINIGSNFAKRWAMHELGHRLEYQFPDLSEASKDFVRARAAADGNFQAERLSELRPQGDHKPDEVALRDHFHDAYVGRVYTDNATEVITTALEHFDRPERVVRLYQQDPEHFFLALGALTRVRGRAH